MNLQELLSKFNLTYETLTTAERETLKGWIDNLATKTLTVDDIKAYVRRLIEGVERDLAGLEEPDSFLQVFSRRRRTKYLLARLQNYLMLEDFLSGPDKARKWLEQQLQNIKPKGN